MYSNSMSLIPYKRNTLLFGIHTMRVVIYFSLYDRETDKVFVKFGIYP